MGERKTGGACDYKKYEGHALVTSVTPVTSPEGKERYEVKFRFYPDDEIQEPFAQTEGKEFLLKVKGGNPSAEVLKRYRLKVDRILHGSLKVIIKGTCTPTLFDFPSIKE